MSCIICRCQCDYCQTCCVHTANVYNQLLRTYLILGQFNCNNLSKRRRQVQLDLLHAKLTNLMYCSFLKDRKQLERQIVSDNHETSIDYEDYIQQYPQVESHPVHLHLPAGLSTTSLQTLSLSPDGGQQLRNIYLSTCHEPVFNFPCELDQPPIIKYGCDVCRCLACKQCCSTTGGQFRRLAEKYEKVDFPHSHFIYQQLKELGKCQHGFKLPKERTL